MIELKQIVLNRLENDPSFRERRNKLKIISEMLVEKYALHTGIGIEQKFPDVLKEAESIGRYWRMLLQENPSLRGVDYNTKEIVEQEHELKLGYCPNYHRDTKLKTLFS